MTQGVLDSIVERLMEGGEALKPRAYITIELSDGSTADMTLDNDTEAKNLAKRIEAITGKQFRWYDQPK